MERRSAETQMTARGDTGSATGLIKLREQVCTQNQKSEGEAPPTNKHTRGQRSTKKHGEPLKKTDKNSTVVTENILFCFAYLYFIYSVLNRSTFS